MKTEIIIFYVATVKKLALLLICMANFLQDHVLRVINKRITYLEGVERDL